MRPQGDARRILLAGAGGGSDIMGAIPLLADLEAEGCEVHLASLSFCYLNGHDRARQIAAMHWWFDLAVVARAHLFLDALVATDSIWDVQRYIEAARKSLAIRDHSDLAVRAYSRHFAIAESFVTRER